MVRRIIASEMLQRIIAIITIVSLCLLALMLALTTPATAGPFGLLLIFVSAYLSCLGLVSFFLYGVSRIISYVSAGFTVKRPLPALSFKKAYYYSTVVAAAPVMLVGLQSVGSVGIYEAILVLLFVVIGCVYVAKRL